ncbi:type II secretion system secretin GspD [Thalassococcus sp. S3]|uniref:type II secretion system secretin GspD n=1 Tax=Thalassococcus sp. S3 TaxID=2017482 RepID=UPI0010247617|nr:type II secretion system secretin GspD [Thalassococcus sp. S3]QBF33401.1 type II secretion system protein GspD [Thalassococcus sp. S3]
MYIRLAVCGALCALLIGCDRTDPNSDRQSQADLEDWRARTILGGSDPARVDRREGRIFGARRQRNDSASLFPGRQPIVRQSEFADEDGAALVDLNLIDVSIEDAAKAFIGDLLDENYMVDPLVSGTINLESARPVTRTTAIEAFEIALRQNNAVLVRRNEIFTIVPVTADLAISTSTARDVLPGYTLRVIPLRNIGAQEMAAILEPFAQDGIVGIDAQRNILVLAGTSADQRSWQDTINSFDVDWLANRSVGLFPIRGRSAQSIVNGLERVVESDEDFRPLVVFEVIPENNSILAVAKTPRALENIAVWIKRLTQDSTNDAQIYSYDMRYARAEDIAPTLSQILGIAVETSQAVEEPDDAAVLFARTSNDQNATRVVASAANNTLLIRATHDEYERVLGILHRLDVPPRQVLVEATILEVSLDDNLRYGVQYFFEGGDGTIGLTRGRRATISPERPGFSLTLGVPANVIIDALDDVTEVNVVSSPNLMILNNEAARLVVGDQVPIATQRANDRFAETGIAVETVEFRDTGVIFDVTPRINSSGTVVLDIQQEVSSVGPRSGESLTPTISQRVVSSSIAVDTGETIVLGGLFSKENSLGNSGIPGLKNIPVAGNLFGRTNKRSRQTELLVLITPKIVNNPMDARQVTSQLRSRIEAFDVDDATLQARIRPMRTENSALIEAQGTDG